jgi:hypothetical protein
MNTTEEEVPTIKKFLNIDLPQQVQFRARDKLLLAANYRLRGAFGNDERHLGMLYPCLSGSLCKDFMRIFLMDAAAFAAALA